jgi:hypothetical protein
MNGLAAELLTIWERGRVLTPAARALHLLALADPATTPARCSIGQRDALLMRLREQLFGDRVHSVAACPACATALELNFALGEVRAEPPGDPTRLLTVRRGAFRLRVRPPTAEDLVALERSGTVTRLHLLERCVLGATCDGRTVAPSELPDEVVVAVAERLARADPQADVQLALACPGCGHGWSAAFDVVTFLWRELDVWARRLLYEVHTLAKAYGWREHEILTLSPERRALYLELVWA